MRTFHSSTLQWLTQPVELEVKDEASPPDELMMQQDNPWESLTDRSSLVSPVVTSPSPSPSPLPSLLYVDPLLGHQALAHLSFMDLLGELGGGEGEDLEFSLDAPSDPKRRALRGYSLRHALAHSCLANDLAGTMRLAFLISYWQRLIADGHFSDVLSSLETFVDTREGTLRLSLESMLKRSSSTTSMNDLSALNTTPPPSVSASGMSHSNSGGRRSKGLSKNHAMREAKLDYTQLMSIREVIHWLRASSSFILKHPQSLPQLAQRAPRDSHVSHATGACSRVLQFDRAHKWNQVPQCQLEGKHTAQVTVVAVGPTRAATAFLTAQSKKPSVGGRAEEAAASLPLLIATGSCDGSIRIWDATISPVDESLGHKLSILVQERKNQQSQDGKSRSSNGSMRLSQTSKVHASHPPLPPPSTSNQPSWLQLQQGREVACLIGHSSEVHSIAFVPDTLNIVSVGK